jgi:hypothetical protein
VPPDGHQVAWQGGVKESTGQLVDEEGRENSWQGAGGSRRRTGGRGIGRGGDEIPKGRWGAGGLRRRRLGDSSIGQCGTYEEQYAGGQLAGGDAGSVCP